jgi:ATP-binding cassette, subfamily B, heavy metal transporter
LFHQELQQVTLEPLSHSLDHSLALSHLIPHASLEAIVGHSGSGKTTVSRLLFRFYDPLSGEVRIGGYNIRHYTQKTVRRCLGIVPQDTVLFNDSLYHNIHYGDMEKASAEDVHHVADLAQIKDFVEGLPEGWETQVGERGLKLSGGEKQRVAIARCLVSLSLSLSLSLCLKPSLVEESSHCCS